jgi:hypothetical protein
MVTLLNIGNQALRLTLLRIVATGVYLESPTRGTHLSMPNSSLRNLASINLFQKAKNEADPIFIRPGRMLRYVSYT